VIALFSICKTGFFYLVLCIKERVEMFVLYLVLILAISYLLLAVLVYLVQELFFFHPEKLPLDFVFDYPLPFEELFLTPEKGVSLNALHFKVPQSKGVVLYFKGNSKSIKGWGKFARDFAGLGYDIFMFDYRGFGKSKGKRTEEGLYHDAQFVYDWLKQYYKEEEIVIYGRSMGSGFAAKVAGDNHPRILILDSPYYSFLQLAHRYMPILPLRYLLKYKIHTYEYIQNVDCKVFVFHGTKDFTIPFSAGLKLVKIMGAQGTLIKIRNGGHNNLRNHPLYHQSLYQILVSGK
jgi:fermentation-respiration switch protein FrsA (DUF1100 family)